MSAALELDRLSATDPPAPPHPAGPDESTGAGLPWAPGREPAPAGPAGCDQQVFARRLAAAGVLDHRTVELPGSAIVLPYGMRLLRRFESIVRRRYEEHGFEEYDYPLLVPTEVTAPTAELFDLDGKLLYAGDARDWAAGRKRAVLSPTGESTVYTHWARIVRGASDLPIRMYRRARYFRPGHSGQGLFRTVEAGGVYEFQACYADRAASDAGMAAASRMARQVCRDAHVPALWSTRPPWTNNTAVAERWLAADVPLPHGATVQVGCVYDQGDRFSRRYGVGWHDGSARRPTRHVTGCLSQRVLLAHLFLGMAADGDLLVHPDLAPVQVAITARRHLAPVGELVDRLRERGVRVAHEIIEGRRETGRTHRLWRRQGVPIRVYTQDPRFAGDPVRLVLVRADTREEVALHADEHGAGTGRLVDGIVTSIAQVGAGYLARASGFVAGRCVPAGPDTVRDVLAARQVAVCALEPTEAAVRAVAGWRLGEVLGLNRMDIPAPCVVTGRPTRSVAYVSPRT